MPRRVIVSVLLALALDVTAATSQPAPAPSTSPPVSVAPVTVQAPSLTHSVALKKSEGFVQTYAAVSPTIGQFTRWRDPVCVTVQGLAPDQAAMVTARIEDVAEAVGLVIARPGCRADIEVVFTDQPQSLLDWIAGRSEAILGFHYASQIRAAKTVTRPIQAWYMTATRGGGSDNSALAFMNIDSAGGGSAPESIGLPNNPRMQMLDTPHHGTPNGCSGHRFTSCLSSLFQNVLIVVDTRRVQGQPLGPIADYLAMLALSQPRSQDGCMTFASVIDLYPSAPCPGRASPEGLTPADAAYLTGLYAGDPEAKKAAHDLAERMAKIVVNAGPASAPRGDSDGARE